MPACGYEVYLLVSNSTSTSLVRYGVEHSKIKLISTRGHAISFVSTLMPDEDKNFGGSLVLDFSA